MNEQQTESKINCLKLETPGDARNLICDVLSEIKDGETMAEHAVKSAICCKSG